MDYLSRCVLPAAELAESGQLDALLSEDLGGRRLLLVEAPDPAVFVRWAHQRACEHAGSLAFLDFGCTAHPGSVVATLGSASVRTGRPNEQLRRLIRGHRVLLMSGAEEALASRPATLTRWLAWCALHLPLSLLCTPDARPYLDALSRHRLPLGLDRLVDPRFAASAAACATRALSALMEAS